MHGHSEHIPANAAVCVCACVCICTLTRGRLWVHISMSGCLSPIFWVLFCACSLHAPQYSRVNFPAGSALKCDPK